MKQKASKKTKSLKTNNAGQPSALLTEISRMEGSGGMSKLSPAQRKKALAKKKF